MVLLGLVAVVVAVVLVFVRPGASQGDEVSQTARPTTPATSAPPTEAPATAVPPTDAPDAEPLESEPPAEAAADGAACVERQIIVTTSDNIGGGSKLDITSRPGRWRRRQIQIRVQIKLAFPNNRAGWPPARRRAKLLVAQQD